MAEAAVAVDLVAAAAEADAGNVANYAPGHSVRALFVFGGRSLTEFAPAAISDTPLQPSPGHPRLRALKRAQHPQALAQAP